MSRSDQVDPQKFDGLRAELERALAIGDDSARAAAIASLKTPIYDGYSYSAAQRELVWRILRPQLFGQDFTAWEAAVILTAHLATETTVSEVISMLMDSRIGSHVKDALLVALVEDIRAGLVGSRELERASSLLVDPSPLSGVQSDGVEDLKDAIAKVTVRRAR